MSSVEDLRKNLPSIDAFLRQPAMQMVLERYGRDRTIGVARDEISAARTACNDRSGAPPVDVLVARCEARLKELTRPSLRRVFNLSGTVIHTNLGRSVMPRCAVEAVAEVMCNPVNLEYDLEQGVRGERDDHIESLLTRLTGAEAALVVNNNAAAVYLVLNTLAFGREVPVSRGELVEIGGAFRVPDIMKRSGVMLVEVGTTNRTHRMDYEMAIGAQTAAFMKVHTSNYSIQGFTAAVSEAELAELAHSRSLPLISDLGSGTLIDLRQFGLPYEPTPREMVAQGVDLVTFSGDKLLGGPQAGLIVGRKDLIEKLRRNPMKRALRLDKMTLAALAAVLSLYETPNRLCRELPVLRLLTRSQNLIREQAKRLLPAIKGVLGKQYEVEVMDVRSQIGSGSLPAELLESCGVLIRLPGKREGAIAAEVATAFRRLPVAVIGRVHDGDFLLDLRCLEAEAEEEFVAQLQYLKLVPAA